MFLLYLNRDVTISDTSKAIKRPVINLFTANLQGGTLKKRVALNMIYEKDFQF